MELTKKSMGQSELKERVLDTGLCTNCGACVNLCPYFASFKDQTIVMDSCDREEGRCYAFCPRTPADLEGLRQSLFSQRDLTPELGPLKGFYLTRAADRQIRRSAQHGGTVTALISLALREGIIDAAVLAAEGQAFLPEGMVVAEASKAKKHGGSKFVVSPNIAAFNKIAGGGYKKIGIVATPCQALALAKMRVKPFPEKDNNIGRLKLVIGLFCGWAFSWRPLRSLLLDKMKVNSITGLDIPPSRYHSLEVTTRKGRKEVSLDEVLTAVKQACSFCFDMTAEFSDLAVGSARLPEGWEVARGWNQVIVRSPAGEKLMKLARSRGVLEFREMPEGNLEKLKQASLNKKRAALKALAALSGSPEDLVYLDCKDPVVRSWTAEEKG